MIHEFGYGRSVQTVDIPQSNLLEVLLPNGHGEDAPEETVIRQALDNPIGTGKLREIARGARNVVIVTSDISRPMPTSRVLPYVLEELRAAGVPYEEITLVFGLGSHRKQTEEERRRLAGDAYDLIRCVDSNPADCIRMGVTKAGTPVDITRTVAEAGFRICLGNIEFHYFAGYSGGAKAIMPGVSTPEAIQCNHRLMVSEAACAGRIDGNPVRADIEEAERMCPADFILNVVLDEHKKVVRAVAGDVTSAHRKGCELLSEMYTKPIGKRADIVIVSQGGAPKDANLYQTQKALDNAKHAVRDGGTIILIGACNEGFGNGTFERWMLGNPSPAAMIDAIGKHFELGGHKAAAIAMVLQHAEIDLVSELDPDTVRRAFLVPYPTAQAAFDNAMRKYGKGASVICMPYGGSTLPVSAK